MKDLKGLVFGIRSEKNYLKFGKITFHLSHYNKVLISVEKLKHECIMLIFFKKKTDV